MWRDANDAGRCTGNPFHGFSGGKCQQQKDGTFSMDPFLDCCEESGLPEEETAEKGPEKKTMPPEMA